MTIPVDESSRSMPQPSGPPTNSPGASRKGSGRDIYCLLAIWQHSKHTSVRDFVAYERQRVVGRADDDIRSTQIEEADGDVIQECIAGHSRVTREAEECGVVTHLPGQERKHRDFNRAQTNGEYGGIAALKLTWFTKLFIHTTPSRFT